MDRRKFLKGSVLAATAAGTPLGDATGGIERLIRGDHWWMPDVSVPADRLVFGSHVPFFPLENSLLKYMQSDLSDTNQTAILHGNADRLLQRV